MSSSSSANAGVDANTGFSFQKCSALYLLLDNFPEINSRQYFMAFEHHDDFLFAFLDESDLLLEVDAFQAKKKSVSKSWGTDKELGEIICKLTETGKNLRSDKHPKSAKYKHTLRFISNAAIELNNGEKGKKKNKTVIKVDKSTICYSDLDEDIKKNLVTKIDSAGHEYYEVEFSNLHFDYINLVSRHKENKEILMGKMINIFGESIVDYKAAVETLMILFHESELEYNQNGIPKLSDKLKYVSKDSINSALNILTSESKAYSYWRNNAEELSRALELNLGYQRKHKEYLHNCFDYFKSLNNGEFIKILHFVRDNEEIDANCMTDIEGISNLREALLQTHRFSIEPYMISFAVLAAYVETRPLNV